MKLSSILYYLTFSVFHEFIPIRERKMISILRFCGYFCRRAFGVCVFVCASGITLLLLSACAI